MSNIKNIVKKIIGKENIFKFKYSKKISKLLNNKENKYQLMLKIKIYKNKNKGEEYKNLFSNLNIQTMKSDSKFYYFIDLYKTNYISNRIFDNFTLDYSVILNASLQDLKNKIKKDNLIFYHNEMDTIIGIENLIDKITQNLKLQGGKELVIHNLNSIKNEPVHSLYEALQRILFFNSLMWQSNHKLNGLGRLDLMLISYYKKDIENKILTLEEAKNLIKEFLETLHHFYEFKSASLLGDTGQIIEVGGLDENNNYLCNELTFLLIDLIKELNLPDPKILLRVSQNMPRELMETALRCIQTGIGCPLLANDDVIIDKLIKFGYEKEDAYNYGTSACWEPYIIGKSSDSNNSNSLNFLKPFEELLQNEDLKKITNKEQLLEIYKKYLKQYVEKLVDQINQKIYEEDPYETLFMAECLEKSKDISVGGTKYNHTGMTSVGLANLVNSILNVDQYVFQNKEMTFEELNNIKNNNFNDDERLIKKLKNENVKYGTDDENVIELSNEIIKYVSEILKDKRNFLGGKFKFGLSSPDYINASKDFPASFDGRKKGEPFVVHISTDLSNAYTELIQFASKLDYNDNRFNGNVVDFFVAPSFISDNFDKFVDFLMLSIKLGFFEMQMNVVSSKKLIEARENPEKFPNLIVRVWGFSAYFNDLPDEYKDYLIERVLQSESSN